MAFIVSKSNDQTYNHNWNYLGRLHRLVPPSNPPTVKGPAHTVEPPASRAILAAGESHDTTPSSAGGRSNASLHPPRSTQRLTDILDRHPITEVEAAAAFLSEQTREIFELSYFKCMSCHEIMLRMNIGFAECRSIIDSCYSSVIDHIYKEQPFKSARLVNEGPPNRFPFVTPGGPAETKNPADARSEHFSSLLATVPTDSGFEEQAQKLAELSHDFRQRVAARLEPALNAHLQAMPHETYEQKKQLAHWVNAEVEKFGLAVKCPKTGQPARLYGDTGARPTVGRFQFQVHTDSGRPKRSLSVDNLPTLELIPANPVKDKSTETTWQETVGTPESRRGRKLS